MPDVSSRAVGQTPSSEDEGVETEGERLDRNWNEILQELRVTQTGTQIISGFLLTLPFQARFSELNSFQIILYLALVGVAALATSVGLGPVGLHRSLFRSHNKDRTVAIGHRFLSVTVTLVALLAAGVVFFIFEVVVGLVVGLVAGIVIFIVLVVVLVVLPRFARARRDEDTRSGKNLGLADAEHS